jgi:predicted acetyltransferase
MQIAVLPAHDRRDVLASLMQLYLYDLSELMMANIGSDGRYADAEMYTHLADPATTPFLIKTETCPIGYALVGKQSRQHPEFSGHSMLSFFILRRYRRQGLGRVAAGHVFDCFPGMWEVATYGANIPAISFWRSVVQDYTSGLYTETWFQTAHWRGSIQHFTANAPQAQANTQHH